jgi:small-conductance mechanosensitive channel
MRRLRSGIARIEIPRPDVTPDFRAAVFLALVAVAFLVVASYGDLHPTQTAVVVNGVKQHTPSDASVVRQQALRVVGTVGFFLFGVYSVRRTGQEVMRILAARIGLGHASVVRWVLTVSGYVVIAFSVLGLLQVNVGSLLLGGAVTGVVVGIAAQQSLGNVFAGVVLLLSRPFTVGDDIRLRSGALAGELNGRVTGMGLTYVALLTDDGPLSVPNAQVLAAAVGPQRLPEETDPMAVDDPMPDA